MELWDVYDVDRRKTGRTMVRGDAFPEGENPMELDYHLVIHVCIFNTEGKMLIQQRQSFKEGWPDKWDITVGGSAVQGDDSRSAAARELSEELGIVHDFSRTRPNLTIYFDHGFDDIYLLEKEVCLEDLKLQPEEVQAAKWATKEEILALIAEDKFLPYYPSLIELLFNLRGQLGCHKRRQPLIALTFDDGPNTTTTQEVLDLLEQYGAKGTFFLIGRNISPESEVSIKRALSLGCEIECHSQAHADMTKFSREELLADIDECNRRIEELSGRHPAFFRPPFILVNEQMYETIPLTFICGLGCEDWDSSTSVEHRAEGMLHAAKDGAIFLLHDMTGNTKTVEALKIVLPALLKENYRFVTLEELFREKGVTPEKGVMYSCVEAV